MLNHSGGGRPECSMALSTDTARLPFILAAMVLRTYAAFDINGTLFRKRNVRLFRALPFAALKVLFTLSFIMLELSGEAVNPPRIFG